AAAAHREAGEMRLRRIFRHLVTTHYSARHRFSPPVLEAIERTIRDAESRHVGEIRFVVESALDLPELWRELTPRQRAVQLFSLLGVWDTAQNNGVLVYVLLADRDVEILADRGIAERVPQSDWEEICHEMELQF